MKKILISSVMFILAIGAAQSVSAQFGKFRKSVNPVASRYIVVLNPKYVDKFSSEAAVESEAGYLRHVYGGEVKNVFANAMKGYVVHMSERAAMQLSRDERVAFVEQDSVISVEATETSASWGLDRIDQRTLPLNSQYSWSTGASNVHAYIIDSGIRPNHVDYAGRASMDYDAVGDGQNGVDCNGHGTHVAGTVGGTTYGVAKNVRIHSVRVIPCTNSGQLSHLVMGLEWVTANRIRPAVANISITASGASPVLDTAVQNAINAGVTVVTAAGNFNMDACNYSPARAANAITVGATNSDDSKAGYSNFGACVDVWAPGTGITSAGHSSDTAIRGMSGTSMASPHVAGIAALYLAANPLANPSAVASALSSTSSTGSVTGLDGASANRMVYSWLGGTPPAPAPASVRIRKRAVTSGQESMPQTAFQFEADNLSTSSFALYPENTYVDSNVTAFGTGNVITVTESQTFGWQVTGISCVETSGSGSPNIVNSTVNLAARTANIIVEAGEQVECTFTSSMIAPSAGKSVVSGRILYSNGRGVGSTRVTLLNASTNTAYTATTNSFGHYTFRDLSVGDFYVLSVPVTGRGPLRRTVTRTFSLDADLFNFDLVVDR